MEKKEIEDIKHWIILYPVYLNSKKTTSEGRRISISKAVENPTIYEIADICKHLGFQVEIETEKAYPRDFLLKGRVRIKFKNNKGEKIHSEIQTKKQLMEKIAFLIPKLQSRVNKDSNSNSIKTNKKKKSKEKT